MFRTNTAALNRCTLCDNETPSITNRPLLAYFAFTLAGISAINLFAIVFYYNSYNKQKKLKV